MNTGNLSCGLLCSTLLAACSLALIGCVQRETPPPNRSAGVAYFLDQSVSPDQQWSLANVTQPQSQRSLRRGEPRKTDLALVRIATGKRAFDFTAFERHLDGTRVFAQMGAFPQPPAWSPDSTKLAIAFHNRTSEDLYVLRLAKRGWVEAALPPHHLRSDLRSVPEIRGRELSWNSEQLTELVWKKPDELHATFGVLFSPYLASVRYAYTFQGSRVSVRVLERWVEPKPGRSE